jgi:DNA-binding MarR family transcriptional regulator
MPAARRRAFRLTERIEKPMDLLSHTPFRIATASNLLALSRDAAMRDICNLETREMRVLINIGSYMPINGADIAYQSRMDSYTVSRAAKVLRQKGLVDVEPDKANRRSKNFVLTGAGESVYRRICSSTTARAAELDTALSVTEREMLFDMLARIEAKAEHLLAINAAQRQESGEDIPADQKELIRWHRKSCGG